MRPEDRLPQGEAIVCWDQLDVRVAPHPRRDRSCFARDDRKRACLGLEEDRG
jgi:hypothetical protein